MPTPSDITPPGGKPIDAGAVDRFLTVVKKLFSTALTPGDVAAGRTNDVEAYVVGGELVISTTTPDGIVLTARKKITRRTLRWVRLWPYVTIVLALAVAILLVWRGDQILKVLTALPFWK